MVYVFLKVGLNFTTSTAHEKTSVKLDVLDVNVATISQQDGTLCPLEDLKDEMGGCGPNETSLGPSEMSVINIPTMSNTLSALLGDTGGSPELCCRDEVALKINSQTLWGYCKCIEEVVERESSRLTLVRWLLVSRRPNDGHH